LLKYTILTMSIMELAETFFTLRNIYTQNDHGKQNLSTNSMLK